LDGSKTEGIYIYFLDRHKKYFKETKIKSWYIYGVYLLI